MGTTKLIYILLLMTTLFSGIASAAEYNCQVESDFRIRHGDNIDQVTSTRLSGTQVCIGEPVVRKFRKADGGYGTDTFRQVRLANGETGWISAKGVSRPVPIAPRVAPIPAVRSTMQTNNTAVALPRPRPNAVPAPVTNAQLPTAPAVSQGPSLNLDIEEGFRLRATPDSSSNSNVLGSTTGADNIQPVYTNGMLDIQNGFIRATNGNKEMWVHESAVKTPSMPALPLYDAPKVTASLPVNPPTPQPVAVPPRKTTEELLRGLPQVDPNLQRAADQLKERERKAHNQALLEGLTQVDPNLQRAIKKLEDERKARNQALLEGLPQVDPPMQRAIEAKRRAHNQALLEGLEQVDPDLQRAVKKLEEERKAHNAALLASVSPVDASHQALLDLQAKKSAEIKALEVALAAEAARRRLEQQQAHNQTLLDGLPQIDPSHQAIIDQKAKKAAELQLLQEATAREAQRLATIKREDASPPVIFPSVPAVPQPAIKPAPADLQTALNALAARKRQELEAQARASTQTAAAQITPASSPVIMNGPKINPQDANALIGPPAPAPVNFLTQLNSRSWLKVRGRGELYNAPGLDGTTKMAELGGHARIAVVGTKRVQYMFEGRRKDEIWLKVVPFDCTKLELVGDPNMQPDDSCNQVYWIKGTHPFSSSEPPTSAEFAARPTPESYLEAAGVCENCEPTKTEADLVGDAIQAHAN